VNNIFDYFKLSPLYELLFPFAQRYYLYKWEKHKRKTLPVPHKIKQLLIESYAQAYDCLVLVETGTYFGSMVSSTKNTFKQISTIELDDKLYKRAKRKFSNDPHIKVLHGDSSVVLPKILKKLKKRALFWLDAHYSRGITAGKNKSSPIHIELTHILRHTIKNHIILIDDANNFVGGEYPKLDELKQLVFRYRPRATLSVKYNIITIA